MKFEAHNGKMFADYITLLEFIINITVEEQNVKNINFLNIQKYILSIYNRYMIHDYVIINDILYDKFILL